MSLSLDGRDDLGGQKHRVILRRSVSLRGNDNHIELTGRSTQHIAEPLLHRRVLTIGRQTVAVEPPPLPEVRGKPSHDPVRDLLAILAAIPVETFLLERRHVGRMRADAVEGLVGHRLEEIAAYCGEVVGLVQPAVELGKVGGPRADIGGPGVPGLASRAERGDSGARTELEKVLTRGKRERGEEPAGALGDRGVHDVGVGSGSAARNRRVLWVIAEYTMSASAGRAVSSGSGVRSEVI